MYYSHCCNHPENPKKDTLLKLVVELETGENIPPGNIINKLREMGYTQVNRVDQPLTFAVRGGIIDIYAINYDQPIRIEFFDTEIESIRTFDVHTQRTVQNVTNIRIPLATDVIFTEESIRQIEIRIEEKFKVSATDRDTLELAALKEIIDKISRILKSTSKSQDCIDI
jgi:transcription-repair coupling factor (superfamily II helicase)